MPRNAREKAESGIFHVMLRGIDRQVIFQDDEDCEKFLQSLGACQKATPFSIYAYCLMGNHVHLLLREGEQPLALIFRRLGPLYVRWYNWKYDRTGYLFQGRFKSEAVKDDAQFLAVLRYIYQNPVKAGLCARPEDYPWSDYGSKRNGPPALDRDKVYSMIDPTELPAFLSENAQEVFIDVGQDKQINDRQAAEIIKELCGLKAASDFISLPTELYRGYLKELQARNCSIRQLSRLTGLPKKRIERELQK